MRWNTRAAWLNSTHTGETACATAVLQAFANRGGAGIQPAGLLLRAASGIAAIVACCSPALADQHPILAIGSPAPDFALPGVDGQIHRLGDYAASRALVVVFTCNHCPIAQMYESRIQQLSDDYSGKGVAVVAIEGNDPDAIRVDELDSSDLSDTLPEMKIRAAYHHLRYPYLYDGETQSVTRAYGPQATPHVFVFDKERRLRYEGRFDNSFRHELVTKHDARDALDAVLSGRPVEVTHTPVFGCSTKWKEKEAGRIEALRKDRESAGYLGARLRGRHKETSHESHG